MWFLCRNIGPRALILGRDNALSPGSFVFDTLDSEGLVVAIKSRISQKPCIIRLPTSYFNVLAYGQLNIVSLGVRDKDGGGRANQMCIYPQLCGRTGGGLMQEMPESRSLVGEGLKYKKKKMVCCPHITVPPTCMMLWCTSGIQQNNQLGEKTTADQSTLQMLGNMQGISLCSERVHL